MAESISITAAGRTLKMQGPIQSYVDGFRDWNADNSACNMTMRDIPQNSTFIDVGANIGFISVPLAVQRPDLRIIAIEPVPHNVEALRCNVVLNGIKNIEVIHAAVSDQPGFVSMTTEGPWSAVSDSGDVQVRCITLNDFAAENVTGVKIDVEGFEPHVLAGASTILSKRPLVYIEVNLWWIINRHHDARTFFDAIWSGSDVIGMVHNESILQASKDPMEFLYHHIVNHNGVSDLLFRPRGPLGSLAQLTSQPNAKAQ